MSNFISTIKQTSSPIFWVYEVAAKLSSITLTEMENDTNLLYTSLSNSVDLFNLPAICTSFDTTLEAVSLGCNISQNEGYVNSVVDAFNIDVDSVVTNGRIPMILDVISRLSASLNCSVLGSISCPKILSNYLLSSSGNQDEDTIEELFFVIGEVLSSLTNSYLDSGADGIVLLAPDGLYPENPFYMNSLSSLSNVLSHYEASGTIVTRQTSPNDIKAAANLGFDLITGSTTSPIESLSTSIDSNISFGIGIPENLFSSDQSKLDQFINSIPPKTILSSEWTIPVSTPVELIQYLSNTK